MLKIFTESEFREKLVTDFPSILAPSTSYPLNFDIMLRPTNRREFSRDEGRVSDGGTLAHGDIVVKGKSGHGVSIYIGAKFDLDDAFEAHLRAVAYDRVFDYPGIGKVHRRDSGIWGSPFEPPAPYFSTPRIVTMLDGDDAHKLVLRNYNLAVEYLNLIDSAEFGELVESSRKLTTASLMRILRQKN